MVCLPMLQDLPGMLSTCAFDSSSTSVSSDVLPASDFVVDMLLCPSVSCCPDPRGGPIHLSMGNLTS